MGKPKYNILRYKRPSIDFSPRAPTIRRSADKTKTDIRYCLISPFAYAHIYWEKESNQLLYKIEEPLMSKEEKILKSKLTKTMRNMINFDFVVDKNLKKLLEYIDKRLKTLAIELGANISYKSYRKIYYYLCRDFVGLREIEPLLRDFFVEDIECNGINESIYIVHRKYGNLKTNISFRDIKKAESFVEKLAQRCGKYISYAQPILDGSLPDGSRVNATYTKDITSKGPTFTIRKFTKIPWTPPQLLAFRTLSPEMIAYLWILIEHKMNILVAGSTGSGKTTLLNALAFFIPPEARVVSIEDTRELNLPRENWLPSVARGSIGTGKMGEVDLFDLLKSSFRQRPDYIVVGEVRGKEAFVLFQGMASGHSSISTIHAESLNTVIKRLETPPINLSPSLLNVLDCTCLMSHATVNNQETRKLNKIVEVIDVKDNGVAMTNTPFVWDPSEDNFYFKKGSKIFEKIASKYGKSIQTLEKEFQRRARLIYILAKQKKFGFNETQRIINEYYKNPSEVLRKFGIL